MQRSFSRYVLDDQLARFDFATCHRWLTDAYWSKGIPRESVEHAFTNSTLVVGAYEGDVQIGCLRAVSDRTRFAFLFDVYVDSEHRAQGLGVSSSRSRSNTPSFRGSSFGCSAHSTRMAFTRPSASPPSRIPSDCCVG